MIWILGVALVVGGLAGGAAFGFRGTIKSQENEIAHLRRQVALFMPSPSAPDTTATVSSGGSRAVATIGGHR